MHNDPLVTLLMPQCRVSYITFVCNHHHHIHSCLARDNLAFNTCVIVPEDVRDIIEVDDSDNDDDVQTAKRQRVEDAVVPHSCSICFEDIVDDAGYRCSTGLHHQCATCFLHGLIVYHTEERRSWEDSAQIMYG